MYQSPPVRKGEKARFEELARALRSSYEGYLETKLMIDALHAWWECRVLGSCYRWATAIGVTNGLRHECSLDLLLTTEGHDVPVEYKNGLATQEQLDGMCVKAVQLECATQVKCRPGAHPRGVASGVHPLIVVNHSEANRAKAALQRSSELTEVVLLSAASTPNRGAMLVNLKTIHQCNGTAFFGIRSGDRPLSFWLNEQDCNIKPSTIQGISRQYHFIDDDDIVHMAYKVYELFRRCSKRLQQGIRFPVPRAQIEAAIASVCRVDGDERKMRAALRFSKGMGFVAETHAGWTWLAKVGKDPLTDIIALLARYRLREERRKSQERQMCIEFPCD